MRASRKRKAQIPRLISEMSKNLLFLESRFRFTFTKLNIVSILHLLLQIFMILKGGKVGKSPKSRGQTFAIIKILQTIAEKWHVRNITPRLYHKDKD